MALKLKKSKQDSVPPHESRAEKKSNPTRVAAKTGAARFWSHVHSALLLALAAMFLSPQSKEAIPELVSGEWTSPAPRSQENSSAYVRSNRSPRKIDSAAVLPTKMSPNQDSKSRRPYSPRFSRKFQGKGVKCDVLSFIFLSFLLGILTACLAAWILWPSPTTPMKLVVTKKEVGPPSAKLGKMTTLPHDFSTMSRRDLSPHFITGERNVSDTTVIINVFKGPPENLRTQIQSALGQQHTEIKEVWVTSFGSPQSQEYAKVVQDIHVPRGKKLHFTESSYDHKFHGRFLLGYMASTKYVLFMDDDVPLHPETASRLVLAMKTKKAAYGVRGIRRSYFEGSQTSRWFEEGHGEWNASSASSMVAPVDYLCGMWFVETVWLSIFFREKPPTWYTGEDMQLSFTLKKYLELDSFVGGFIDESSGGKELAALQKKKKRHAATRGDEAFRERNLVYKYNLGRGKVSIERPSIDTLLYADDPKQLQMVLQKLDSCGDEKEDGTVFCHDLGRTIVTFTGRPGQNQGEMTRLAVEICSRTSCEQHMQEMRIKAPHQRVDHYNMRVGFGLGDTPLPMATCLSEVLLALKGILENVRPKRLLVLAAEDANEDSDASWYKRMVQMAVDLYQQSREPSDVMVVEHVHF